MGLTCRDCGADLPDGVKPNTMYCADCAKRHRKETYKAYIKRNADKIAKYYKDRYEWLKAHHICVVCASVDAEIGSVYCPACHEKAKAQVRRSYTKRKKA